MKWSSEHIIVAARYVVAGGIAAGAHFICLIVLVELFTVNPTVASAVGFCVAIVVNYNLQYRWTFRTTGPHAATFTKYLLVTLTMLGVNTAFFWTGNVLLGWNYILVQILTILMVLPGNYIVNRNYTFALPETVNLGESK